MKYEIAVNDVWSNEWDGFWVNQSFKTGEYIHVDESMTDDQINHAIATATDGRVNAMGATWDGDPEYSLQGDIDGYPVADLIAVES